VATRQKQQSHVGNSVSVKAAQGMSAGAIILLLANLLSTYYFNDRTEVSKKLDGLQVEMQLSQKEANIQREKDLAGLRQESKADSDSLHQAQSTLLAAVAEIRARLETLPAVIYEQTHRDGIKR